VLLSGSLWRKAIVTTVIAVGFVSVYEVTMLDSQYAMPGTERALSAPTPGQRLNFMATAYCKGLVSASGVPIQSGIAASDPSLLPIGSIVELDSSEGKYDGVYTILDTGPAVQGREIDVYMWSCHEALRFGRQPVRLNVVRLGWNPQAVTPSVLNRLFKRPEPKPQQLSSRPLPQG
jgi:3D (Asp-Asp-Asp) domain-containing protein